MAFSILYSVTFDSAVSGAFSFDDERFRTTGEAQKLETPEPQSLRVMYRESQHYLAFIRFPTLWGLL